jgi:hypothetical protein
MSDEPKNQPENNAAAKLPNNEVSKKENLGEWKMPAPVFRVSSGTKFVSAQEQTEKSAETLQPTENFAAETLPAFRPLDKNSSAPVTQVPPAAPIPAKKSSKLKLILVALLVILFLLIALAFGAYWLFNHFYKS